MKHIFSRALCFCLFLSLFWLTGCTAQPPAQGTETDTPVGTDPATAPVTPAPETSSPSETPTDAPTAPETEAAPLSLRIGSYNIATGRQISFGMRTLGKAIADMELDILGVQEIDQFATRSGRIDTMKQLSKTSGMTHYVFFKAIDFQGGEYGIGILSKYPILETERYELSSGGMEQRVLGRALIDVNGTHINFFVTHLSYEATDIRTGQFAELAEHLSGHTPYILVGDFNTADYAEFDVLEGAAFVNNAAHSIGTFPDSGDGIDNIVYTAAHWQFSAPAVVKNNLSDHYLLYATATLTDSSSPAVP